MKLEVVDTTKKEDELFPSLPFVFVIPDEPDQAYLVAKDDNNNIILVGLYDGIAYAGYDQEEVEGFILTGDWVVKEAKVYLA